MLTLLAALGFAFAAPLPSCALAHPERCTATNELVVSPGFETALRRFVGPGRASWFEPNGDITDQLLMTLYGPGFDTVRLPDGMFQFGACMAHICPERGAVFVTPAGEIRMATMLFHNCGAKECTGEEPYTLAIFLRGESSPLTDRAKAWAAAELAADARQFPALVGPEDKVGFTMVRIATQ